MNVMVSTPSHVHNGRAGILQTTSTENQDRLIAAEVMTKFSLYASKSEQSDHTFQKYLDSNIRISSSSRNNITSDILNKQTFLPLSCHSNNQKQKNVTFQHSDITGKWPSKASENNGIPQSLKVNQHQEEKEGKKRLDCGRHNQETSTDNLFSSTHNFVNDDNDNTKNVSNNIGEQMIVDTTSHEENKKEKSTEVPFYNDNNKSSHNNCTNCTNNNRTIRKKSLPVLNARILKELLDSANNQGLVYLIHPFHDNFLVRSINQNDFICSFLKVKEKSNDVLEFQTNNSLTSNDNPIWGIIKKNRSIHFFDPIPKENNDLHNIEHPQNRNTETNEANTVLSEQYLNANSEPSAVEKLASTLPLKKRKVADSLLNGSDTHDSLSTSSTSFSAGNSSKPTKSVSQITEECIKDRSVFIVSPSDVPKFVKPALLKPRANSTSQQLTKNIEIALCQDEDGDLPLHIATVQKDLKMVQLYGMLIQRAGKSIDRYNKKNLTPLHLCVKVKFLEGLQKLIQMGADVNALDGNGQSALHIAVSNSDHDCFEFLLQQSNSYIKDPKMKPNLNSHDYEGLTLLHTAVNNNNIKMIGRLLQIGAELDAIDFKSGRTPLFHAVENNNIKIVKFLLEKKASVDIPNFAGNTAFLAANTRNYHSISKLLAENGADTRGLMPPEELTSVPKVISTVKSQLKNKLVSNKIADP